MRRRLPKRTVGAIGLVVLAVMAGPGRPGAVGAHIGGEPFLHVPANRVLQGETFTVIGADLGADALVTLEIVTSGDGIPVGQVVAGPDGHFTEMFVMPGAVPDGYVELWARSSDGTEVMLWVLVGDAEDPGSPGSGLAAAGPGSGLPWPIIALGAAWIVGLLAIGLVYLRARGPGPSTRRR